ncbi:hypothetical protein UlMin_044727 [Ulmus minor]
MVGLVQEVECDQNGLCLGTFIRVRAIIDVSKPLKRILKVRLGSDKELVTILLRYENLPELCFHCGVLGHPLKECPSRDSSQGDSIKLKYGAWIKTPAPPSGATNPQSKRRRPSSGPSLPAPPHGNSTMQPPRKSTSKAHHSLHPSQQPIPQHHPTPRWSPPSKKERPQSTEILPSNTLHPTTMHATTTHATSMEAINCPPSVCTPHPLALRTVSGSISTGLKATSVTSPELVENLPVPATAKPSVTPGPPSSPTAVPQSDGVIHCMGSSSPSPSAGAPDAMNILAWNVQGLGNDWTFRILHAYVQQYSPSLVFLSETLSSNAQMEHLRFKLGYSGMLTWGREGRSGGLCLLWSDSITVQLLSGSKGHIDVVVSSPNSTCWRFTGLYGNPDTSLRPQFWDLMKRLKDSSSLPWLCRGDMNEILFDHEKKKGGGRASYLLRNFREAIEYCNLADLGFWGPKFTWCRGNYNSNFIQERLDRMLGNSGWSDMFPNSIVHHLGLWGSDHRPLLIEVLKEGNLDEVANKLQQCASDLSRWNLEKFSWLREEIKKKTIAFNQADRALSSANWRIHQRLERELEALKYKEERYWQQRSKDLWLKSGDRNSKFFHRKASARRAKNSIVGLFDSNENWCEDKEGIAHIAESYFTNLFSSSSPHSLDVDMVLNSLEAKVSPAMNEQLDGPFVAEDVRAAVFQMAPSKSPGADGMSALFYQNYWAIVGDEVTAACLGFLNKGLGLGSINETLITLLPKVKCPTHITEFRPISLYNVLYKIISKMLATRMRSVMDSIISEEQSAFIPGRLISDNAIIGFECIHALKRRRSKKKGFLALKLDMAKAYDRVEWSFIREVMKKLGFSEGWIKKILDCVTSVYYSLLLNGEKVGYIRPSRGLRQGDPLSPYLFLLCAEGLSSLIHNSERTGQIQGMRCGTNGPTISHLFFADDSLLFIEATPASCHAIKKILLQYETASGQLVNYSKSAVCFGPSISEEDIGRMVAILGVPQVKCHKHYLGLPCFSGKNKSKLFASIKDRIWNKLCGWKSKLLSAGGREILTKAIIQAIPTYSMNMFRIPISLIKELHRLCARFWWGGDISKQKIHWCTWEQLCVYKKNGGMGFRDLRLFNKAILAKQAWHIHSQPSSLVARVLQGFYFTSSSFLQVKKSNASSFVWRSILWGREVFL